MDVDVHLEVSVKEGCPKESKKQIEVKMEEAKEVLRSKGTFAFFLDRQNLLSDLKLD